jgi:hypothetical protein
VSQVREADAAALQPLHDVSHSTSIGRLALRVDGPIPAVVHSVTHCCHRRLKRQDVRFDSVKEFPGSLATQTELVGADAAYRLAREQVSFDESRIKALFGDRIAANRPVAGRWTCTAPWERKKEQKERFERPTKCVASSTKASHGTTRHFTPAPT